MWTEKSDTLSQQAIVVTSAAIHSYHVIRTANYHTSSTGFDNGELLHSSTAEVGLLSRYILIPYIVCILQQLKYGGPSVGIF